MMFRAMKRRVYAKWRRLFGKTLTIVPATGSYESIEYKESGGVYLTQWDFLPAIEYKLNVVGVYYASYDGRGGNPNTILSRMKLAGKLSKWRLMRQIAIFICKNIMKRLNVQTCTALLF